MKSITKPQKKKKKKKKKCKAISRHTIKPNNMLVAKNWAQGSVSYVFTRKKHKGHVTPKAKKISVPELVLYLLLT